MAHSRSAEKRIRQNSKRRLANKMAMSALKTRIKRFGATAAAGDAAKSGGEYMLTAAAIDKAAKTGRLHPNNAARKKSRLARMMAKAQPAK